MNQKEIVDLILQIDNKINKDLKYDLPLSEQGLDSLALTHMFFEIEEKVGCSFTDENIRELKSINQIVNFISQGK